MEQRLGHLPTTRKTSLPSLKEVRREQHRESQREIRSGTKTQRARTKVKDVIQKAVEAKGKWAGHMARMKNHEWAKKTTEWTPLDRKRAKGRPKIRWRDDIEKKAGSRWTQRAQDRNEWRKMWRSSASCGMTRH